MAASASQSTFSRGPEPVPLDAILDDDDLREAADHGGYLLEVSFHGGLTQCPRAVVCGVPFRGCCRQAVRIVRHDRISVSPDYQAAARRQGFGVAACRRHRRRAERQLICFLGHRSLVGLNDQHVIDRMTGGVTMTEAKKQRRRCTLVVVRPPTPVPIRPRTTNSPCTPSPIWLLAPS